VDYFISDDRRMWLDDLVPAIISEIDVDKVLICNAVNFKLELDAFIFSLPFNWIIFCMFTDYGYGGCYDRLLLIYEGKISIVINGSLFNMDFICHILKFLHMAV
jgi:hypothetical protein